MSELNFSDIIVHNEIQYCKVHSENAKKSIERAFLDNQISYYEKWEQASFFKRLAGSDGNEICILCINGMQVEKANEVLNSLGLEQGAVDMILKKVDKTFF